MKANRERWSSKLIFIFATVGSAIGLGNVWRFPYLVGKYGGGAFLIPYLIMLVLMGIPLLIMEFALGQKMQLGSVGAFRKIHPKLQGVGLASILCGFVVVCYYCVVMAWSILYMFFSFDLKWGGNTESFFYNDVLKISSSVSEMGMISPAILFALVACWVMIYFTIWHGVKSAGKVVAITMPLPVILLIALLLRGLSLPGSWIGLSFYLKPDFSALWDPDVWNAAMSQIFFTLTIGFGVMIAYASYEDKNSDVAKSALITAVINSSISIISGFAVFSTLGYMSLKSGIPIDQLAKKGPSLAFIVFPQALSLIPGAKFFAVAFFIMLITLAVDSAFSLVEAVSTVFMDKFRHIRQQDITLYICVIGFIGGIVFATQGGIYYLDIVDHFITHYGLVTVGLLQCIAVGWVYKASRLRQYINEVSDIKLGAWWDIAIRWIIPACLITLLVNALYEDLSAPYGGYASWALICFGWVLLGGIFALSFGYSLKAGKAGKAGKK